MTRVRGEAENMKKAGRRIRRSAAIPHPAAVDPGCGHANHPAVVSGEGRVVHAPVQATGGHCQWCYDTSPVSTKFIYTSYINIDAITYFYRNVDCDLLPVSLGLIIPLNWRAVLTTAL